MNLLFKSLEIRYKFLISFSIIFFLSMLLCSLFIYAFVKKNIEANIENELNNTTHMILNLVKTAASVSIKNHLRAVAEKNEEIVRSIYNQSVAGLMTETEAKERASTILLSQTIGTSGYIYCMNRHGTLVIHPRPDLIHLNLAQHAFVARQMKLRQGYLEYEWKNVDETSPRPKALYMTYFKPWDWIISVCTYRSEFTKLLNIDDFQRNVLSLRFGKTGYSFVMDDKGNAIIHPTLQGINLLDARKFPSQPFKDILKRKKGKTIYYWKNPGESRARQKLVIFNYIPEYQWTVASYCDLNEFHKPLETIRNFIFSIAIAFLMLLLPITFKISSTITNPLRELMIKFDTAAAGDFTVRMQNESRDEVGQLTVYFNRFMEQLGTYHKSLQDQIQERRVAEEAQRETQEKYFLLMEAAPDPIVTYDMKGNVTYINPAFTKVFQWKLEECSGRKMDHFVPEENWSETKSMIQQIIAGNSINNIETRRYSKNGHIVDVSTSGAPILDRNKKLTGSIITHRDITKSKLLEKQVMHSGDRERQKIGQDLHDDLCPHLIGIAGLGTVLKDDLMEQGHEDAALAEKIVILIDDAIEKTRNLARGLCPVHLVSHGIQTALDEIIHAFEYTPGIEFQIDVDKTVVFQDNNVATHLYHIAREAVNNAVKHANADNVQLSLTQNNGFAHLYVRDNGQGIKKTGKMRGIGLQIMPYRAKIIGAQFDITTGRHGTTIHVYMKYPLTAVQEEADC